MKYVKVAVALAIIAVVGVGIYYYVSNKEQKTTEEIKNPSQVTELLATDLDSNYPVNPREVVELYTNIQICFYNEDCSEEEITKLAAISRKLFDESLLAQNPESEYLDALKKDIDEYKDEKKTISRVIIDKSSEIEYVTMNEIKNAIVNCTYYSKENKASVKTLETYVLRQDAASRWKIYGFKLTDK